MSSLANYESDHCEFANLNIHIDENLDALFMFMKPSGRHVFSLELLKEIQTLCLSIAKQETPKPKFLIIASGNKDVFNYGGDLNLFSEAVNSKKRDVLVEYGYACIDVLYRNYTALDLPLTTISLVQGDALGGGFEAALASQVLIAEKGVKMGFPEILFNLFPGMGAYELLSEKLNASIAKKMILSEKLYSAEELYDIGLVDVLAEKGMGEVAVEHYIHKARRNHNGRIGLGKVAIARSSFDFNSLEHSLQTWVDCAMNLTSKDLKMMARLVKRQNNKVDPSIS